VTAGAPPLRRHVVAFDPSHVEQLAGIAVDADDALAILKDLGFSIASETPPYAIGVPEWRGDIDGSADLVEEVMRIKGLDAVPNTPLPRSVGIAKRTLSAGQRRERSLRRTLAASGLNEAITYAFIKDSEAAAFLEGGAPIALANAISSDMTTMRPSLLPGLLRAAQTNLDRGQSQVSLFELGRAFRGFEPTDQPVEAAAVLAGQAVPRSWSKAAASYSVFDAKSLALIGLKALGAPVEKLQVFASVTGHGPRAVFHPGQAGELRLGPKNTLARFGLIHPKITKQFGLSGPVAAVEWLIENAPQPKRASGATKTALKLENLQPVERDFAFIVSAETPAQSLVKAIQGADKTAITNVQVFDRYDGVGLQPGTVSLGVCVTLQPRGESFTEAALDALAQKITKAAEKSTGATLRA
ncbi:MAG: phenylalanine--tRNA ligase subunit beta, partial [Pseudomonadota bacterium]